jgi:hypothetical protein
MSEDLIQALTEGLQEAALPSLAIDSDHEPEPTSAGDSGHGSRVLKKWEVEEKTGKPRGLSNVFQRQIRWRAKFRKDLVARLATHVAYTILPGDYAADFSAVLASKETLNQPVPLVPIKQPRLAVCYRFPEGSDPYSGIALVGYRITVDRNGRVTYGGAPNATFAKNVAIKPHPRAGGAAIDSTREQVLFKTALSLDWAMECAAEGFIETVDEFTPPPLIFGFPTNTILRAEGTDEMKQRMLRAFSKGTPPPRSFVLNRGGLVLAVSSTPNGMRTVKLEVEGNLVVMNLPKWLVLSSGVVRDALLPPGYVVADFPRFETPSRKTVTHVVGRDVTWVMNRLLGEATETITLSDKLFDKTSHKFVVESRTLRCIPAALVPGSVGRAVGKYLDLRGVLGRTLPDWGDQYREKLLTEPYAASIQVRQLAFPPNANHGLTGQDPERLWTLDFAGLPEEFGWLIKARDGTV